MTFHFSIEYRTQWGEELRVAVEGKEYALETIDGARWEGKVSLPAKDLGDVLTYHYVLYRDGQPVWTEWERAPHRVWLGGKAANQTVRKDDQTFALSDFWRPIPDDLPLFSTAFAESVASHGEPQMASLKRFNRTLQLRITEPRLQKCQRLGITGNTDQLGNWQQAQPLTLIGLQEYAIDIDVDEIFRPLEYKYVVLDEAGNIALWEDGANRVISSLHLDQGQTWVKTDTELRIALSKWKGAGVVIPVFRSAPRKASAWATSATSRK